MIRRNELNKILQLIDAGVLISDQEIINHIDGLSPIVDNEIFTFENQINKITNEFHSIDLYIEDLRTYIDKINVLSNLRISKNAIKVSWEVSFVNLSISIEDVCFDEFIISPNTNITIDEINLFLTNEFRNIKNYLINPSGNIQTTKIEFKNLRDIFINYRNKFAAESDYLKFIDITKLNFEYQIKLNYTKTPIVIPGGQI